MKREGNVVESEEIVSAEAVTVNELDVEMDTETELVVEAVTEKELTLEAEEAVYTVE